MGTAMAGERELRVEGVESDGGRTDYKITVNSDDMYKGGLCEDSDEVTNYSDGSTADGFIIDGGVDNYFYSGQITYLEAVSGWGGTNPVIFDQDNLKIVGTSDIEFTNDGDGQGHYYFIVDGNIYDVANLESNDVYDGDNGDTTDGEGYVYGGDDWWYTEATDSGTGQLTRTVLDPQGYDVYMHKYV